MTSVVTVVMNPTNKEEVKFSVNKMVSEMMIIELNWPIFLTNSA